MLSSVSIKFRQFPCTTLIESHHHPMPIKRILKQIRMSRINSNKILLITKQIRIRISLLLFIITHLPLFFPLSLHLQHSLSVKLSPTISIYRDNRVIRPRLFLSLIKICIRVRPSFTTPHSQSYLVLAKPPTTAKPTSAQTDQTDTVTVRIPPVTDVKAR